ncbi:MAG: hypothetical protein HRT68_08080 [Flavobacteriaceae bacterium]|nr:hypothetical protein [Flavobacteriaceae bacterium]
MSKKIFLVLILTLIGLFISCENEPLDPGVLDSSNNGGNPTCQSCELSGVAVEVCEGTNGNAFVSGVDSGILYTTYIDAFLATGGTCQPSTGDGNGGGSGTNSFFCKIDGLEFNPSLIQGLQVSVGGNTTLNIVGTILSTNESIGFSFPTTIVEGDYTLDSVPTAGSITAQYNNPAENIIGHVGNGSITITLHDTGNNRITGNFAFIAEPFINPGDPTFTITEGSFDIFY